MNKPVGVLMCAVVATMFMGCGGMIGSPSWFEGHSYGKRGLAPKASFDLACPEAKLTFVCVGPGSDCTSSAQVAVNTAPRMCLSAIPGWPTRPHVNRRDGTSFELA